jgi:pimeloyl-ACP methyl ester carboxylesterase
MVENDGHKKRRNAMNVRWNSHSEHLIKEQLAHGGFHSAHKTVRTPLRMAGAMGLTKYLLPSLSVRGLGAVEGLMISSLSFFQIAFLVIRHPLFLDQNLLAACFQLSRRFLASPIAGAILGGLVIGHLVTGVVLPGKESPERWNIPRTLEATGVAVAGGLVSLVLSIPGLLIPIPWGYGLIAAGFFLGPWLHAQFNLRAERLAAPSHEVSSRWPNRREALRSILSVLPFLAVWMVDAASAISVEDNRLFLKEEESLVRKPGFPESPSDDKSLRVARLSSGFIRYRVMNPQGRNLVLGFHGLQESLYGFPLALEPTLKNLDIQGIFIDRPGIGPVSTPWPGHDLADWAGLVEEFDKKVLDSRPISIIGNSAGGVYALACAKLACVRALGLVGTPAPLTYGSFFRTFFDYDAYWQEMVIGLELFPHKLLPDVQLMCQQISYDWKSYFIDLLKAEGPIAGAVLTQNEDAFRKSMGTAVLQGAAPTIDDFRRLISPWPLTLADTTRVPILIFRGAGDQIVPLSATQELQTRFAPHATRIDLPDLGHEPALKHFELIFSMVGKLHVQEEEKRLLRAP